MDRGEVGSGEVLKERAVGEGVESLAVGGRSRVAENPGPVLAESDELLRGVGRVIAGPRSCDR